MSATDVAAPRPLRLSGVMECPAELTFESLAQAAEEGGWSLDGIQPEPRAATVGQLLERRAPRPPHFGGGLLRSRCVGIQARLDGDRDYISICAPRRSSGPDLAYLLVGGEGRVGRIERASLALVRPAPGYLVANASFAGRAELFQAVREIALIDPLATRHVSLENLELAAYVPARTDSPGVLLTHLEDLGAEVEAEDGVPEAARFRRALDGSLAWRVSAPYATIEALCGALEESSLSGPAIDLTHSDCHGAAVVIGGGKDTQDHVEKVLRNLLKSYHFDDVLSVDGQQSEEAGEPPFQLIPWRRPS